MTVAADRGLYQPPDALAAALSRALRPITDYRVAARHGLPHVAGASLGIRPAGLGDRG
jgi:hypothetical protein